MRNTEYLSIKNIISLSVYRIFQFKGDEINSPAYLLLFIYSKRRFWLVIYKDQCSYHGYSLEADTHWTGKLLMYVTWRYVTLHYVTLYVILRYFLRCIALFYVMLRHVKLKGLYLLCDYKRSLNRHDMSSKNRSTLTYTLSHL